MSEVMTDKVAKRAADYLSKTDPKLAPIIVEAGLCTTRPHRNYYQALVGEIIGQQLSVKAADSIRKRFEELFGGIFPEPNAILRKSVEELRGVGLSYAKANYICDLAQHVVDGKIKFDHMDNLSNQEIIAELIDVKGIGEWTAHMFLMFCMARTDILATGDLGIRNAVKKLYDFEKIPSPDEIKQVAEENNWHPYESVACWYLWHSLDNTPA